MSKKISNFFKTKILKYVDPLWRTPTSDQQADDETPPGCFYLFDQILVIPFPSQDRIAQLSKFLNNQHNCNYTIFNLSQRKYSHAPFDGQVVDYSFPGLPCPPLQVIFSICNSIKAWCLLNQENLAVIHCQGTMARSALQISCFLSFMTMKYNHPLQGLSQFCELAKVDDSKILLPSQKRYLGYFDQVLHGLKPEPKVFKIQRIIINGVPNMKALGLTPPFRPYVQIFRADQLIFTDYDEKKSSNKQPSPVYESDLCTSVDVNSNVQLEGDILIRLRHFISQDKRIPMLRMYFHTYFIDSSQPLLRFCKSDIDGLEDNWAWDDDFFMDLIIEQVKDSNLIEQSKILLWKSLQKSAHQRQKVKSKVKQQKKGESIFIMGDQQDTTCSQEIKQEESMEKVKYQEIKNKDNDDAFDQEEDQKMLKEQQSDNQQLKKILQTSQSETSSRSSNITTQTSQDKKIQKKAGDENDSTNQASQTNQDQEDDDEDDDDDQQDLEDYIKSLEKNS